MSEAAAIIKCFLTISLIHNFVRGDPFVPHQDEGQASLLQTSHLNAVHSPPAQLQLYSPWSQWSSCSTTCGRGISMRSRICNKRQINSREKDETLCHAESVENKICQLQACPPGTPDFRSSQCSQYNDRLVAGQRAKIWVPTNGGANPCELRCEAVAEKLVYVFGKAADGTTCSQGVCLDGRCLKIGCDDRIGSGAEMDMCGLCSGRNATCVHYTDIFYGQPTSSHGSEGRGEYQEVLKLPVGARNFKLWKSIGNNILAIRDRTTALIFHKDSPQLTKEQRIAGTFVLYSTEKNTREILTAKGPTVNELYVLVLMREKSPGIHYQYWLPLDQPHHQVHLKPLYLTSPTKSHLLLRTEPTHTLTVELQQTPAFVPTTPRPAYSSVWTSTSKRNITESAYNYPIAFSSPLPPKAKNPASSSRVNYGPKRLGLAFPKNHPPASPASSSEASVSFTASPIGQVSRPKNSFLPVYKLNYKTRKPVFNYYEKYRNNSYHSDVNVYERKTVYLPQQTQGDSSEPSGRKNEAIPKDSGKKLKFKGRKSDLENQHKNLSSRWEYKINGKENHSSGTSLLNPPVSITVLPLPDTFNVSHSGKGKLKGSKHPSKSRQSRGGLCEPCQRVREMTKQFCSSDFVVHATILTYEFLHGETRYELEVLQSFKNILALLPREYIWSPDTCKCPKLRVGKDYILMGKIDNSYRRNESRLLVDKSCFVRIFSGKQARRLHKLRKNHIRKCSKFS